MGVYLNQAGYELKGEKRAVISTVCDAFSILDESGAVCFEGRTKEFGYDKASGDNVMVADFSDFQIPGRYHLVAVGVDGVENGKSPDGAQDEKCISPEFVIGEGVYDPLFRDLMRAFYYLRCGMDLDPEYAGKFGHKACHLGLARRWEDVFGEKDGKAGGERVTGGWHDAGDYGRYITAGACALAHLLYAYRMFPESFRNRTWNIPESGNGVPDLLNECRYELEWFLKMQREDGGVYHKETTAGHAAFVMPQDDLGELYLLPVSSMATADHAAICAMASAIYEPFDGEFAGRLAQAARKGYGWLEKNPDFLGFRNPEGCGTGEYGEWNDDSNRFWAASEMYALTKEECYLEDMKKCLVKPFPRTALGYGEVGGFGALAFLLCDQQKDEKLREDFLNAFALDCASRIRTSEESGYGTAMMDWEFGWGSNMGVMQKGMLFAIVDYFGMEKSVLEFSQKADLPKRRLWPGETEEPYVQGTRENREWGLRDFAAAQLDYLLGCNPLGVSYVTGTGENAYRYPHFRPSHADGIEESVPGLVSGGPNRRPADEVGRRLIAPGTPSMKCYLDRYECYSLNEITIYWNSPAVFVLAYLCKGMP